MSTPEQSGAGDTPQDRDRIELSDAERKVLMALMHAGRALDTVAVASAASLGIDQTLTILRGLRDKGMIEEQPPEAIRERFRVHEDALQRAG